MGIIFVGIISLFAVEKTESRFGVCSHFTWNQDERNKMEECLKSAREHGTRESHFGIFKFDLEPKLLALAYKNLIKMLGEKSTPSYTEKDGMFVVNWIRENNVKMSAIWSVNGNKNFKSNKLTTCKCYDIYGKQISPFTSKDSIKINESPIFIEWN